MNLPLIVDLGLSRRPEELQRLSPSWVQSNRYRLELALLPNVSMGLCLIEFLNNLLDAFCNICKRRILIVP